MEQPNFPHLTAVLRAARENLKNSDELLPTFFVGNDKDVRIVATPFGSDDDKDRASLVVRAMAAEMRATYIMFVSETWMVPPGRADEFMRNRDKYPSVSDFPGKLEKLYISIETESANYTGLADILPGREIGEIKWNKPNDVSGRFANLLGHKPVMQ